MEDDFIKLKPNGVIDVLARLQHLDRWKREWLDADTELETRLFALKDSSRDIQIACDIEDMRKILQYRLIKTPIDMDANAVQKLSIETYRIEMIKQFAALSKDSENYGLLISFSS